jgi:hypothetical protein
MRVPGTYLQEPQRVVLRERNLRDRGHFEVLG